MASLTCPADCDASDEPCLDLRIAENPPNVVGWHNAHSGVRSLDDFLYGIYTASDFGFGPSPAPIVISEWNTRLNNVWPAQNYPIDSTTGASKGLLRKVVRNYIALKDNVMGFASFVDQNYGGGCPRWLCPAVTGYLDQTTCIETTCGGDKRRLAAWDTDFDNLLATGW